MFKCQECGKKFKTAALAQRAANNGCPKCGGVDIDLDDEKLGDGKAHPLETVTEGVDRLPVVEQRRDVAVAAVDRLLETEKEPKPDYFGASKEARRRLRRAALDAIRGLSEMVHVHCEIAKEFGISVVEAEGFLKANDLDLCDKIGRM